MNGLAGAMRSLPTFRSGISDPGQGIPRWAPPPRAGIEDSAGIPHFGPPPRFGAGGQVMGAGIANGPSPTTALPPPDIGVPNNGIPDYGIPSLPPLGGGPTVEVPTAHPPSFSPPSSFGPVRGFPSSFPSTFPSVPGPSQLPWGSGGDQTYYSGLTPVPGSTVGEGSHGFEPRDFLQGGIGHQNIGAFHQMRSAIGARQIRNGMGGASIRQDPSAQIVTHAARRFGQ